MGVKTGMLHFDGYVNAQVYMDDAINDQVVPLFQARPNLILYRVGHMSLYIVLCVKKQKLRVNTVYN